MLFRLPAVMRTLVLLLLLLLHCTLPTAQQVATLLHARTTGRDVVSPTNRKRHDFLS